MAHLLAITLVTAVAVAVIGLVVRRGAGERRWPWVTFKLVCTAVSLVVLARAWNAPQANPFGVIGGVTLGVALAGTAWDIRRSRFRRRSA